MMRILFGLLIGVMTSLQLQAAVFSTKVEMTRAREVKHTLRVTCALNEDFCELLCQNQNQCEIEQLSCVDCVSQTYRLFKAIFTEINQTFVTVPQQKSSNSDLIEFLRHERWMVLSHDSFYNTFTPEHAAKNKMAFNSMCPGAKRHPEIMLNSDTVVIVRLDSGNKPEKISHVICHEKSGTRAYGVEFNVGQGVSEEASEEPKDQTRRESVAPAQVYVIGTPP